AYPADVSRRHRWIRGDWQIIPWLGLRVRGAGAVRQRNPISNLSRWKIFDNLRRSLVPLAIMGLLLFGWFLTAGAVFYTMIVLGIIMVPPFIMGLEQLARRPSELPYMSRV